MYCVSLGWSKPYLALRLASISGGSRRWLLNGLPGAICTITKVIVRTTKTSGPITSSLRKANRSIKSPPQHANHHATLLSLAELSPRTTCAGRFVGSLRTPVRIHPGVLKWMVVEQIRTQPAHVRFLKTGVLVEQH